MLTLGARFDRFRQQDEKLAEELKVQQKRLEPLEKSQVKLAPPAAKSTSAVDVSSAFSDSDSNEIDTDADKQDASDAKRLQPKLQQLRRKRMRTANRCLPP